MNYYSGLNHLKSFIFDDIFTTYHHTSDLDPIIYLSPSLYWQIHSIKLDATCSRVLEFFLMMTPFLGSTTALMMVSPLFVFIQEMEETSHQ